MGAKKLPDILGFQKLVLAAGVQHWRDMPWRQPEDSVQFDPYKILVSEIMLQQTQVPRVAIKYQQFLNVFPTVNQLAKAPLADVLRVWSGLGYNRRAKYLHDAAKQLASKEFWTYESLIAQKGIGHNTAAAIRVYAYNEPHVFIETNVRSVFLHHFFQDKNDVSDKEILPLLEQALSSQNPRKFYWALMDYGTYLKQIQNPNVRSRSYVRQARFNGSLRQVRGAVIRELTSGHLDTTELTKRIHDQRLPMVLKVLTEEGLIQKTKRRYFLPR